MKSPLSVLDVVEVAKIIKKLVSIDVIIEVLKRYPSAQEQDPSATWDLVIEQLIHEVSGEVALLEREKDKLIDKVIERIRIDIIEGDETAIDELLRYIPVENLKGYLAED